MRLELRLNAVPTPDTIDAATRWPFAVRMLADTARHLATRSGRNLDALATIRHLAAPTRWQYRDAQAAKLATLAASTIYQPTA